jgi:hypothetical protein
MDEELVGFLALLFHLVAERSERSLCSSKGEQVAGMASILNNQL